MCRVLFYYPAKRETQIQNAPKQIPAPQKEPRGCREGWARGFTRRLRKESPSSAGAETGPKSHLLADSSDYFHIHKHLMRPGRAIHMFTPHQTAKRRVHHIQQPHTAPSCCISACAAPNGGSSSPTQTPCSASGSLTKHGRTRRHCNGDWQSRLPPH